MNRYLFLIAMLAAFLMTACSPQPALRPQDEGMADEELAKAALINFFAYLHAGEYDTAADLYDGSYETMIAHNPDIDPDDHAALFRAACEVNGAQCLEVERAILEASEQAPEGVFQFSVVFRRDDGSIFSQEACCGEEDEDRAGQREFTYAVIKKAEYLFMVLDPPVYAP